MKKLTLSNERILGLHHVLESLSKSTLPIKFTVAKNLKTVAKYRESYLEEKEDLHKKFVVLNDEGVALIKDAFADQVRNMQAIPYHLFQYDSEEQEVEFFKQLKELTDLESEITLAQEDLSRKIKVKTESVEGTVNYESLSLQEVLEISDDVDTDAISKLLDYEILK